MEKLRRLFSLCVFSLLQFCNDSSVAESRDRTLIKSHARSIRKDFYQENTSALNKTKKTGITSVHILVIYYPTSNNFARDISTANVASREIYFKKKKRKRTRAFDTKKIFQSQYTCFKFPWFKSKHRPSEIKIARWKVVVRVKRSKWKTQIWKIINIWSIEGLDCNDFCDFYGNLHFCESNWKSRT